MQKAGNTFRVTSIMIFLAIVLSLNCFGTSGSAAAQQRLTGRENHAVSQHEAKALLKNHRDTAPAGTLLAEYFGGETIRALLDQPNCVGLRIYFGNSGDVASMFQIVGVDANGWDLSDDKRGGFGFPCPPICDSSHVFSH